MVLFAVVKTLIRFFAVTVSICISSLVALAALRVAYAYVESATLLSAPAFVFFPSVLEGLSVALIPSVFFTILSMTVYYGRHQMSAVWSRVLLFVFASAVLFGGMWILSRQRAIGLSPLGTAPGPSRVSGARLASRHGEILDYGASALVVFDGALVEASKDRALSWIPLDSTAIIELPGEPRSAFAHMLNAGEPLDSLLRESEILRDHFERLAYSSPPINLAICIMTLILLLISFQGLGVLSPWPLANALMTMLIMRLALAAMAFLYSDARVLALFSRFLPKLPSLWGPPAAILALALCFMAMNAVIAILRRPSHG